VQTGAVEAGQPHVAHDDEPKRVGQITEPLLDRIVSALVADVRPQLSSVRGAAGEDDLDDALVVVI
jgi:hypothetical protein